MAIDNFFGGTYCSWAMTSRLNTSKIAGRVEWGCVVWFSTSANAFRVDEGTKWYDKPLLL
jgi:hypothetical protein